MTDAETLRGECDLTEAIPDDDERADALDELTAHGRYVVGGGAAPFVLLMRAELA